MKNTKEKTNVGRILDQKKIEYGCYSYELDASLTGSQIARIVGVDPERMFKTLVTTSHSKQNYVFVVPVDKELDLKKAAKAVNEKSIEMVKMKDLLALTGYVHGGCSPIGMKKFFPTVIDSSAQKFDKIIFSAGKVGHQVEVSPTDLKKVIEFKFEDITVE